MTTGIPNTMRPGVATAPPPAISDVRLRRRMSARTIRVLLLEDNPGDARLVQVALHDSPHLKFEVSHFDCLASGVESAQAARFDVVLTDLSLPDAEALEAVKSLRQCTSSIPIVVLTGTDDETVAMQALNLGAQDYLVKGEFDSKSISRALYYSIERKAIEGLLRTRAKVLEMLTTGHPIEETLGALVRSAEDVDAGTYACVNMLDGAGRHLRPPIAETLTMARQEPLSEPVSAKWPCDQAACTGRRVVVRDVHQDTDWSAAFRDFARNAGLTSCWSEPIRSSVGDILGTFDMFFSECREPDASESEFLKDTSNLAALVIHRHNMEQELQMARDQLAEQVAQLTRSNKELDDFAYIASHDLKEPLRGIHNNATFLLEDNAEQLDEDGRFKLQRLTVITQHLETLINSLLYYSRVGRSELAVKYTDLNEVLRNVLESLAISLENKNVEVRIPRPLPCINCDQSRISEVFRNLISNATKYNDKPSQWIEIGYETELQGRPVSPPASAGHVHPGSTIFYVRDNGIGIPAKNIESIFRMFRRLHGRDKFGGGTGAGLAFAKKIVERHHGRMWVDSVRGQGSTFYFTLQEGNGNDHDDTSEHSADSAGRGQLG